MPPLKTSLPHSLLVLALLAFEGGNDPLVVGRTAAARLRTLLSK